MTCSYLLQKGVTLMRVEQGSEYVFGRISLESFHQFFSFKITIIRFIVGPYSIKSLVLGHLNSVKTTGMCYKSNYLFVGYYYNLCAIFAMAYFTGRTEGKLKLLWLVSLGDVQNTLLYQRH